MKHDSNKVKQLFIKALKMHWNDHDKIVLRTIKKYRIDINQPLTEENKYPLHFAAECQSDIKLLQAVLDIPGININVQDNHGWTALMYAAKKRNIVSCELLINHGINYKLTTADGKTVLDFLRGDYLNESFVRWSIGEYERKQAREAQKIDSTLLHQVTSPQETSTKLHSSSYLFNCFSKLMKSFGIFSKNENSIPSVDLKLKKIENDIDYSSDSSCGSKNSAMC